MKKLIQYLMRWASHDWGMLLLTALISGAYAWISHIEITRQLLVLVAHDASIIGLISLGALVLHHTGEFDVSVGAIFGLSLMVLGMMLSHVSQLMAVVTTLLVAGSLGAINGALTVWLRSGLLLTGCMMILYREIALAVTGGRPNSPLLVGDQELMMLSWKNFAGLPISYLVLLLMAYLLHFLYGYTALGRNMVATGIDAQKASYLGLQTQRYKLLAYVFGAVMAALAALVYFSRLSTVNVDAGMYLPFQALCTILIANNGLRRDRPAPLQVVVTATLVSLLQILLSSFTEMIITLNFILGLLLLFAFVVERYRRANFI